MSLEGVGASFALFKVFGTGDGEEGHGGKFSVFSFHGRGGRGRKRGKFSVFRGVGADERASDEDYEWQNGIGDDRLPNAEN
jgi:hypothetical protein